MAHYLGVMTSVVLPIVIVCLFGAILQRLRGVKTEYLADVSLYVLAPCLIIVVLGEAHLQGHNVAQIIWFTLLQGLFCFVLATVVAKLFRMSPKTQSALTLTTIFSNANNYGLPVLLLAYGQTGLVNGAAYVIGQIILSNTLGMFVASRSNVSGKQALLQVAKTPLIYAVIVGVLLDWLKWTLPTPVHDGFKLLSDAYPGLVLLILGVQLGRIKSWIVRRKDVWIAVLLRVCVVPILSALVIWILHIHGMLASILFVQSSMPAAVNNIIYATKYGSDDEMVTLTVAITTILSFLTIPLLIAIG